jgi:dehydrogenase/reductase SDR family member 7B
MENKVIIITGASGGIGEALAKKFAGNKSKVVIAGRDKNKLDIVLEKLLSFGTEAISVICDVSKEEDCRKLIQETVNRFGCIDVLINNAGISMRAIFNDLNLDVLRKVMDVNFWGTVYCSKFALPYLLKSHGSIIGISSIAGKKGLPGRSGYSASKFAMEGFLETIRTENLKKNLHVLVACPGFTTSNIRKNALTKDGNQQSESPRAEDKMMSAEAVASLIYKAVVNRKRDLIITGNGKLTLLLNKIFPSMMDKAVYNHMAKEVDSPFT